jgi:hypothetical protein
VEQGNLLVEGAGGRASDEKIAHSVTERASDVRWNRVVALSCCLHLNSAVPN